MKKFTLALAVLAFCAASFAQVLSQRDVNPLSKQEARAAKLAALQPLAPTTTCSFTFSSGSGNTFIKYCVTANGNIAYLETPSGQIHIGFTSQGEGYGVCDANVPAAYYDYAIADSGNWAPPILVSSSATSVTIKRSTSDANWTVTQTITIVPASVAAKVKVTLKNNTATARTAYLVRYADFDAPDGTINESQDGTTNSTFAWVPSPNPSALTPAYGAMLQVVGTPGFPAWDGFAQNDFHGPNPCAFAFNWTGGTAIGIDGSQVMAFVGNVPALGSKSVTLIYKGM
jgi:hypothetical protein